MFITESANTLNIKNYSLSESEYQMLENTDFVGLALEAASEDQANFNAIAYGIGTLELQAVREGYEPDDVFTEGVLNSLWEKIKQFFIKLKDKMKQFFAKIMLFFNKYTKSNKEFYKKYVNVFNKKVHAVDLSKIKMTLHEDLKVQKNQGNIDDLLKEAEAEIAKVCANPPSNSEEVEEYLDKLRGQAVPGSGGSISASDFAKEMREEFIGTASTVSLDEIGSSNLTEMADYLQYDFDKNVGKVSNKVVKFLDKAAKQTESVAIKGGTMKDEHGNDVNVSKDALKLKDQQGVTLRARLTMIAATIRGMSSILTTATGVTNEAYKIACSEAKTMMSKVIRAKTTTGEKVKIESAVDADNIFGSINLR